MLSEIHIVNGPNLNLLHLRPLELYGGQSFDDFMTQELRPCFHQRASLHYFQSNSEGAIIDFLQTLSSSSSGLVFNPAAFTHYSLAIADTVELLKLPIVEVHISDLKKREARRQVSLIRPFVNCVIEGEGLAGYKKAVEWLLKRKREK